MTEEELLGVIEQAAREGWTELDLSGKDLTVLPREIGKLTQLKKLILGKYDKTAKLFADEFYRTLALGWPVDAAIQTTRNAISIEVGQDKPDFATPVLYMRAKDGIIMSGF
ncbi:hypothetical protein [Floridanema aerugineum]|uniref:Uncharacterized protein n=1 Tax=Floridaenema aerugineum BLCC-F46 TaxID=3153654 RepID=A0ABV4XHB5_9CYAN